MSQNTFGAYSSENLKTTTLDTNYEEFKKIIFSRRSVRIFTNDPIPEHIIHECLDLALLAPNSSNLQPWEFYWVKSKDKKIKIKEACLSQPAAQTAAEIIVCIARTKTWRAHAKKMIQILESNDSTKVAINYYKKTIPFFYTQGFLNIFGMIKKIFFFLKGFKNPTPRGPVTQNDMILWATKSCALAAENFMLALRAASFDSCPMEGFDAKRVQKILNLPGDAHIVMIIGAGRRAQNGIYGPRIRFNREIFIKEV
jgi:nitroreductase